MFPLISLSRGDGKNQLVLALSLFHYSTTFFDLRPAYTPANYPWVGGVLRGLGCDWLRKVELGLIR